QPHIQFHISLQFRKEASSQLSIHSVFTTILCQVMCFIISINNGFLILHENVKLIRVLGLGYEWKDGEGINKSPQKEIKILKKPLRNNLWLNVREIEGRRIVELWLMAHIMEKILNFMTLADIGQWFYFGVIGLIRKHQPCIYQISHLWNKMKHFCNMLLCIYKSSNLQENKASFHMFYQEEGDNYLLFYSSLAINFGARNTRTL
ncbi:hypothetical protein ACJX0J_012900, partial [Zea mays]